MKKILLATTAIAVLFVLPAQAADMPIKAPPPAPVMTSSWAGFYVGAHVGYGYAVTGLDAPELQTGQIIGIGSKGWVAGGLAGYNMMLAPRWVGGIEFDGSWQDIKTKVSAFGNTAELKAWSDWSASVRGRLGYLVTPSMMLFASAGWSWSAFDISITNGAPFERHSGSLNGPQIGFGAETMFADNWIWRTEYLHAFYNDVTVNTTVIFGNPTPVTISPWVGVIRSALIYKPGSSSPTPWPDRAPTPIWSGLYVGGMLGPMMASAKISVPAAGLTVDGGGLSAVVPSLMVGYNFMIAPRIVVSLEGEIAPNIATSDVEIQWTGGARLRGGLLITPGVLAYGTVGWATSGFKDFTQQQFNATIPVERVHALSVGSGVEAALTDRWRLRADYQRYFSDTVNISLPGAPNPLIANVKGSAHAARLGAIYQISGP